jgi:hypothetical protein
VDIKIADLRNDGNRDLVVANLSRGMVALLNKGDGTFGKPTVNMCSGNCLAPESCVSVDFNLDGKLDVTCAAAGNGSYFSYGKGNGKFGPAIPLQETIQFQGG